MRYLKKKVSLYPPEKASSGRSSLNQRLKQGSHYQPQKTITPIVYLPYEEPQVYQEPLSSPSVSETMKEPKVTSSKTIVKNFGKAMCSFASSELALPYIREICNKGEGFMKAFQLYIKKKKKTVDSIEHLRVLLLVNERDNEDSALYKRIFQHLSIIFIKYFSVNWIFQGKMTYKDIHLKARFKMLRRVQNPEYFTYFKGFVKEAPNKQK